MGNNKLDEAMSRMHTGDDFYEKVLHRAEGHARPRRGAARPLGLVATVAVSGVLATGSVAYAAVTSGFFQEVWGGHGTDGHVEWSNGDRTYSREFGIIGAAQVSDELSRAVQEVGLSLSGAGYTLSIDEMIADENGAGAVTFSLEKPDGLNLDLEDGAQPALVPNAQAAGDLALIEMQAASGAMLDTRCYFDEDSVTETSLKGVMYFTTFGSADDLGAGVSWRLGWAEASPDGRDALGYDEVSTDVVGVDTLVGTRTLAGADGASLSVSPLSARLLVAGAQEEVVVDRLALKLSDGEELAVEDDGAGVVNSYHASLADDGSITFALTKFVDVDDVASATVSYHAGAQEYTAELA